MALRPQAVGEARAYADGYGRGAVQY